MLVYARERRVMLVLNSVTRNDHDKNAADLACTKTKSAINGPRKSTYSVSRTHRLHLCLIRTAAAAAVAAASAKERWVRGILGCCPSNPPLSQCTRTVVSSILMSPHESEHRISRDQ